MDDTETLIHLSVRPNDLDAQGHVNNAVGLEYLEAGRWDWFARHRLVPDGTVAPVVARAEIDYLAPVPYTRLVVATRLVTPLGPGADGSRAFRADFRQEIRIPQRARPALRALITLAFVDRERGGGPVSLRAFRERAAAPGTTDGN
ncbi:acyl-CoA thioesterase [Streptomyces sp. NPDC059894]|uniref:acyl-CoA thioesterase n=1 Tax=unclassified Streptomyces TaxID=2593676 RepID=UPI00365BC0C4